MTATATAALELTQEQWTGLSEEEPGELVMLDLDGLWAEAAELAD